MGAQALMTQNWTAAKLQRHAQQLSPAALATVAAVTGVASPEALTTTHVRPVYTRTNRAIAEQSSIRRVMLN